MFTDSRDCQKVRLSNSAVEKNCVDKLCQRTTGLPVPASNAFGIVRMHSDAFGRLHPADLDSPWKVLLTM